MSYSRLTLVLYCPWSSLPPVVGRRREGGRGWAQEGDSRGDRAAGLLPQHAQHTTRARARAAVRSHQAHTGARKYARPSGAALPWPPCPAALTQQRARRLVQPQAARLGEHEHLHKALAQPAHALLLAVVQPHARQVLPRHRLGLELRAGGAAGRAGRRGSGGALRQLVEQGMRHRVSLSGGGCAKPRRHHIFSTPRRALPTRAHLLHLALRLIVQLVQRVQQLAGAVPLVPAAAGRAGGRASRCSVAGCCRQAGAGSSRAPSPAVQGSTTALAAPAAQPVPPPARPALTGSSAAWRPP